MAAMADVPRGGSAPPTDRWRRAAGATAVCALLFGALVILASLLVGGQDVLAQLGRVALPVLAGMLTLSLLNFAARTLRWQLFCAALGLEVPMLTNAAYYFGGFALTATPGKMGEALRLWFLKRSHGITVVRSAGLMIGDRLSDMSAVVLLCLLSAAAFADYAGLVLLAAVGMGVFVLLLLRPALLRLLIGRSYEALGRGGRLLARIRQALRQMGPLSHPAVFGGGIVLALTGWFAEAVALWWLVNSLGAPLDLSQAVFIFSFGLPVGALSMLPGGLGGTEATMVGLLLACEVPADIAVAATAIIRATTLWFATLLGIFVLPIALRRRVAAGGA